MTRLWLVRHGPTHLKGLTGWTDLPADLSDAAALARLRARLPAAPVVSSDLARAVATADALGADRRLPHDPRLREIHFGAWEGLTAAEAEARDPALARPFWDGAARAPGGEGWEDMSARVLGALAALAGPPDLIVVAHLGPILAAHQRAAGLTIVETLARTVAPLSLTRVEIAATGWRAGPVGEPA